MDTVVRTILVAALVVGAGSIGATAGDKTKPETASGTVTPNLTGT